jgi:molybdenum cofactor sulfurtransferase
VPWRVTPQGLLHDRQFFLISTTTGRALSQKQYPRMALIHPVVNLATNTMSVTSPVHTASISIPLTMELASAIESGVLQVRDDVRLCADKISSLVFMDPLYRDFFSEIVDVECTLAFHHPDNTHDVRYFKPHLASPEFKCEIGLSNESPYLLISESSVALLSSVTQRKVGIPPAVFRANFVLSGNTAYSEDRYQRLRIGNVPFDVLGPCRRCHMVCVDPERGVKEGGDVFLGLGKTRRRGTGGVVFGVHMGLQGQDPGIVTVGDKVIIEELSEIDSLV